MIEGLAKAVALYLAPALSLTSLVLAILVFLAPSMVLHTDVSLLQVYPSSANLASGSASAHIDGPSVWLGVIGSCSRASNSAPVNCTSSSILTNYDLSALTGKAPAVLTAPSTALPVFVALALVASVLFLVSFTLLALGHKLGRVGALANRPSVARASAWLGFFGWLMGLSAFLVLRLWFAKAIEDFNTTAAADNQALVAVDGNGFIMIWVAYAFFAVPLACALSKLHVTGTGGQGKA